MLRALPPGVRRAPVVLMYHAFGERLPAQDPHYLFVTESALGQQLAHLRGTGYRPLDLDGYLAGLASGRWPERSFLVTIDDGYTSTLDAAQVLAAHDVPSLLFVSPGRLGGTSGWMLDMPYEPLLDVADLAGLADLGMEVGVHGFDHADMPGMEPDVLAHNVVTARDLLEDALGYRPRSFAYPRGLHDAAARAAVEAAGYDIGFAVHHGQGRYAVPRVDVNATDVPRSFRVKLQPWYLSAKRASHRLGPLWRGAHHLVGRAR